MESAAINTYLGDEFSSGQLVPLIPRPLYEQTIQMITSELDSQGLWIHRKHESLGEIFGNNPDAVVEAKRNFKNGNRVLISQLGESDFILGNNFTAADILWVHTLDWAESIGWNDTWAGSNDSEKLKSYLERCRSRTAYIKTVEKKVEEEEEERLKRKASVSKM